MSCWISLISGSSSKTPCKRRAGLECLSGRQDADTVLHPGSDPIRFKLILVGDRLDVAEFQMLDRDMAERIFLRADLVSEVNIEEDLPAFLQYLAWLRARWALLDFTPGALLALCRHASRLCDHQEWLSLSEVQLGAIMRMADSLARELEATSVTDEHILLALEEQDYRLNYLVEQSDQGVIDGQILLQTDGEEVGQINGLSVIQVAGHPYDFGEPVRLTATVHLGDGDVADIERKAELAGHIHAKAMMIIHGYLSNKFGAENPRRSRPTWCSSSHTTRSMVTAPP